MYKWVLFLFWVFTMVTLGILSLWATDGNNNPPVYAWIGCDGTAVTRTDVGKITITHVAKNLQNCNGPKSDSVDPVVSSSSSVSQSMTTNSTPSVTSPVSVKPSPSPEEMEKKRWKIILDLAQKDIVNYRVEKVKEEQIRYANAIRSMRIRSGKSMEADTSGYLIKNQAVQVTGKATGWTPVRSGEVVVTDARENTVTIDTATGTSGYVGTRLLRNPTPADLIKIGQADIAYWSDIVHTQVSHLVNIRSNPWYTSSIVQTVESKLALYRTATIDNWSQVQTLDGSVSGFIRSDFLVVDKAQLIETKPLLK